jgi:UDP-glucose 4-epimerase
MKKILVTGGAGYIGSHTVVELIQAGYDPVVIDSFINSDGSLISGIEKITGKKVNFHKGDCCDKDFLTHIFKTQGPIDAVIHFAALKSVGESGIKPLEYHQNNIGSLMVLLGVMKDFGTKDIIFSSSCTVYGQPDQIPVNETAPFKRAESAYGATKQICERILEDVSTVGYRVISLRYFNPIGAHTTAEIGEIAIGTPNNLIPFVTQAAAGLREKLTVFGNDYDTPDGSCIRDYIHVVDVAVAHVKALDYLNAQSFKTLYDAFNLGSGIGISVLEVIEKFKSVTGANPPYTIGPRRAGDIVKVYADPQKANKVLNWKTKYSIEDGLLHAWKWQQKITK